MKLGFEETQSPYDSGSQSARFWTERWVADWGYCPNCGHGGLSKFANNQPLADFHCESCSEEFELKSHKKQAFGNKVLDGAYATKIERLNSATNPNLLLMNYDLRSFSVTALMVVPKHFFTPAIVEKRKPLSYTARRAGWIGSNILLSKVPDFGKLYLVRDGVPIPKEDVRSNWERTKFLQTQTIEGRGWLLEVLNCVELLKSQEFSLEQIYAFQDHLARIYPANQNVRPKIRQQLQVLRDSVYLEFIGRGKYRIV